MNLWYLFWIAVATVVLAVWCWAVWRDAKKRVQFSILDFWVVILTLAPAMWAASKFEKKETALCFLLLILPHQIGSAFIFGNDSLPGLLRANRSTAWSVATTFVGALMGWMVPLLTMSVGFVVVLLLALALSVWPVTLVGLITYLLLRRRGKHNALQKDST